MYLMIAYYTPKGGFTANNALFYKAKLASYTDVAVSFQLIIYVIIKISIRATTVLLY